MKRLDENLRKKYIRYLEDHVSKKRLKHSLGVAETAVKLAEQYGADPVRAEAAGLLHDCSKGLRPEEMVATARAFGMEPDPYQLENPELLHPYVSAMLAARDLGVTDGAVLCAIRRHMCGAPDMSVLDAAVNLADYIEPTRSYPGVEELRTLAEGSLFDTLCEALGRTMILTIRQGSVLHPDTLLTWNALILRSKAEKEKKND
ncbi:MAG: bis(5'-nucleosyl)-tetraphosphatase (symmetrical) YqeK [Candidatus Spyradocola sp.]|jgi:predicted HD superfamily hydrolase involved in NAD metabolism